MIGQAIGGRSGSGSGFPNKVIRALTHFLVSSPDQPMRVLTQSRKSCWTAVHLLIQRWQVMMHDA